MRKKKAYFTYATTRFRWGKIVDGEPSRFLEEVSDKYLEVLNLSFNSGRNNSGLSSDLFDDDFSSTRRAQPQQARPTRRSLEDEPKKKEAPQNLKPLSSAKISNPVGGSIADLKVGDRVLHDRFGKGEVLFIEGDPDNAKALIKFDNEGEKKLLLKFAKLKVL